MPALFGYLVAVPILLGGSYATCNGCPRLKAVPGEKKHAHSNKVSSTRLGRSQFERSRPQGQGGKSRQGATVG